MKKSLLKKVSIFLGAVMLSATMQIPAFADVAAVNAEDNFDNQTASATYSLANGSAITDVGATTTTAYEKGLGGRDDYALVNKVTNVPYNTANTISGGFVMPNYVGVTMGGANASSPDCRPNITMEVSVLYGGDADSLQIPIQYCNWWRQWINNASYRGYGVFIEVKDGVVKALGKDTGVRCGKDEWLRVAIVEDYDATKAKVYVNGVDTGASLTGNMNGNIWTQANLHFDGGKTGEGTRNGYIAIDDVKIYDSAYAPTGKETVSYTVEPSWKYNATTSTLYVEPGTTIADAVAMATTTNDYSVYTAKNNGTVIEDTTAEVAEGNVVIYKSEDGKSYDYLTFTNIVPDKTIKLNKMAAGSANGYENIGGRFNKADATGLYGKAADDYSVQFTLKDDYSAPTVNADDRNTYIPEVFANFSQLKTEVFTTEFSVAGEGNFDEIKPIAQFTTEKIDTGAAYDNAFISPVVFSKKDGVVVNGEKIADFKEKQWYRVAVTYDLANFTVDVYINGEEAAKDLSFIDEEDVGTIKVTGFPQGTLGRYWFALQQIYKAGVEGDAPHSGSFAFDDTYIYYGEYNNATANAAGITSTDCYVDEKAGEIYVESGLDLYDLEDMIEVTGDWQVYKDNTYSEASTSVEEGAVILVKSENGFVCKYYEIKMSDMSFGNIQTYVNNELSNMLSDNCTIKATLNAQAPKYLGKTGVLVLAIYNNGALDRIICDNNDGNVIDGDTLFEVSATLEAVEGVTAKAMFWNSLEGLEPVVSSQSFGAMIEE